MRPKNSLKMKKLLFTIALTVICVLTYAQTVEMNYTFNAPTLTQLEGYEQVQMKGCMQSALIGQPSLPWQSVSLMLPEGQEAVSIEVFLSDFVTLGESHELYPYQPALTYSNPVRREFFKDETLYNSKAVYPSKAEGMLTTQYMNGIGFAFSSFTPVQYTPSIGLVSYATKARVVVHTTASKADHSNMLWLTQANCARAMRLAQNPEMINSYGQRDEITGYDMLIITGAEYVDDYDAYREYYNSIGLRNEIFTTENICSSTEGNDDQDRIRNFIINEYTNNGIMMVVLGGDVDIVPYRGLYCYVTSGGGNQESNNLPADLYYSGLDGNWNTNGNERYGEPGEDDLLPEIGISRMSFQNSTDLANMINKTLSYQQNPVLGEFHKVILAGEHLYDNPTSNGSDYLELLIGTHDDNGYTTTCYPTDYDFTKLYEEEGNWSGSLLRQAINEGTSYVHHDGHANSGYVAGWYGIDNADFSGVNGTTHNYTFFHSQGCDCGAFDQNCILERMVKIENFAVAVIGNSRYGWFNEGQTEGPGCHLEREMTDAQWFDRIGLLSCAHADGKCMTAPWVTAPGQWEEGALRWNFYDMNVLGDGAVNVWLDEPFTPVVECPTQVVIGSPSMEVTVTDENGLPQKNFRCLAFMEDQVVAMGVTDENGVVNLAFAGGNLSQVGPMILKITGVNAWPLQLEVMSVPNNSPYVVYDNHILNGGANQIEFGGTYAFDLTFKNLGNVDANNVTATISCESEYITINQSTVTIGNLNGDQSVTLENIFSFSVSDAVPNNTIARFNITCTDGNDTWDSHFNTFIYAPEFQLVSTTLDISTGNYLLPGDGGIVHFIFKNNGNAVAPAATFIIDNIHPEIITPTTYWDYNAIEPGMEFTADFNFTLTDDAQLGVMYELPYNVTYNNYKLSDSYYISVGQVLEGFETGDFSAFDWHHGSIITAWEVVTQNPYEGQYCAKSASISDYETTALSITLMNSHQCGITFYYKVSSESNYDKLHFYIDEQEKGSWSGEVEWTLADYVLPVGEHTLRWEYSKDVSMSSGSDCAWIDNVVFPPSQIIAITQEVISTVPTIYPNPSSGSFSINLPEEDCEITVYNQIGQVMHRQSKANGLTTLNLNSLAKGMYFVTIKSDSLNITQKLVKE